MLNMIIYSMLLLFGAMLLQREIIVKAESLASIRAAKEREIDEICLETDIDRLGGKTSSELHSLFTSTKVKSSRLGQKYREKLLKYILKETEGITEKDDDPVFDSCGTNTFTCDTDDIFRSADGSCNNLLHPDWGQSFIPMRRSLPPQYDDGVSSPRTKGEGDTILNSTRTVSLNIHTSDDDSTMHDDVTHMTMQFAQFLDHDITNTPIERGVEGATITCCEEDVPEFAYASGVNISNRPQCFPIGIPPGDRQFGRSCMNFVRSVQVPNADCKTVPAEQLNQLTAYIDGSQVYGSTEEEQHELRAPTGGLLKISDSGHDLLPRNTVPDCVTSTSPSFCFRAGDERVNEHMGLTSMHTIWLREHNRIATKLAKINRFWDDERLFQETRKIVGAMLQHITYTEFLPLVLSSADLKKYNLRVNTEGYSTQYDPSVDPSIRNSFATAAYRFGHSLVRSHFSHYSKNFKNSNNIQLTTSFGNTSIIISSNGDAVNTLTRGLLTDPAQSVDRHVTREISDLLFLDKDGNSFDLMALNIQRGRDHGLPGYNEWRRWCGMSQASSFKTEAGGLVDHSKDAAVALNTVYSSTDDIELFPGGLSENPVQGALIGPTFSCIIARQFQDIKIGDRFWYETGDSNVKFTPDQLKELRHASLARVICDNTDSNKVQPSVFRKASKKRNPLIKCSKIPKVSLGEWRDREEGMWTEWLPWSPCQKGRRTRTRTCNRTGRKCPGSKIERESCGTDCSLSDWSEWGRCVKGCRYQIRTCPCKSCKAGNSLNWERCGKRREKSRKNCDKLYKSIKRRYWK